MLQCYRNVTAYSFVSVIANFPLPVESVITQSLDHVGIRLSSQLINGISTNNSTSFVLPASGVFPVVFTLNLNDSESSMLSLESPS